MRPPVVTEENFEEYRKEWRRERHTLGGYWLLRKSDEGLKPLQEFLGRLPRLLLSDVDLEDLRDMKEAQHFASKSAPGITAVSIAGSLAG